MHSQLGLQIQSAPARGGPMDAYSLSSVSEIELAAPMFPRRISSVLLAIGPDDAPALPHVSIEELAAPGLATFLNSGPKVNSLVLTTLFDRPLPATMSLARVESDEPVGVSPARVDSSEPVGVGQVVDLDATILSGNLFLGIAMSGIHPVRWMLLPV